MSQCYACQGQTLDHPECQKAGSRRPVWPRQFLSASTSDPSPWGDGLSTAPFSGVPHPAWARARENRVLKIPSLLRPLVVSTSRQPTMESRDA